MSRALGAQGQPQPWNQAPPWGQGQGGRGSLKDAQPGGARGWGGQGCGELEIGSALFPCKAAVTLPSPSHLSHLLLTSRGRGQASTSSPPCLLPLPSNQIPAASIRHGVAGAFHRGKDVELSIISHFAIV